MNPFQIKSDLNLLHPAFKGRVKCFLEECRIAGIYLKPIETRRTKLRQLYLWGKGRFISKNLELQYLGSDSKDINGGEPKAKQVTWTLFSRHLEGLAADFAFVIGGKLTWNGDWAKVHEIGLKCGLKGTGVGDQWNQDQCHFEYDVAFKK